VCNFVLAEEISEYLADEFDIIDENTSLYDDDIDEYYLSLYFNEDEAEFCCECARGISGNFKITDCEDVTDYYIFLEMTDEEIKEKLLGKGSWGLYDLEINENEICDGECEDCNGCDEDDGEDEEKKIFESWQKRYKDTGTFDDYDENDDDECEAISNFVSKYTDKIIENGLCPHCTSNTLIDFYFEVYNIGARDAKLEMKEQLSNEIEDMDE